MPRESGIGGGPQTGLHSGLNTGMGAMQGYGASGQGANGTMMGMQQAPAANHYQNAGGLQNAQAQGRATYTKEQFNNKRGSDFKKTAQ